MAQDRLSQLESAARAARAAGNESMRCKGSTTWDRADWFVAEAEFGRHSTGATDWLEASELFPA